MQSPPEGVSVQTLAVSDLVDSTKLVRELGDARAAEVMRRIDRVCRDALEGVSGLEIDKSDGFLMLFGRPLQAAEWALLVHDQLSRLAHDLKLPISLRVGIHIGEVFLRRNRDDDVARGAKPIEVEGLAKPLAARVMSLASGGQTLLTRPAFELARRAAKADLTWTSHGAYQVKGIDTPIEVCEVTSTERTARAPQKTDKAGPAGLSRTNLREQLTRFVGRHDAIDTLRALLDDPMNRLVTLLGPGGTGKTRLVTELGLSEADRRSGGVWFCDLAPTQTTSHVVRGIADALQVPLKEAEDNDRALTQLGHALDGRGEALLILDNFEQVAHLAQEVVARLLRDTRTTRLLVTSRTRLGLPSEQVMELGPLTSSDAVSLFADRARRVRPGFAVDDTNRATLVRICERLDQMPLAIELSAARIRTMPPARIEARLTDRFRLLRGKGTGRQSTMRSTIDWSWDQLDEAERSTLMQLATFRGGFFLDDAEAVVDLDHLDDPPWTEDIVEALRDKSLLRAWVPQHLPTELRLGMYETIREYAQEKLEQSGTELATQRRHAEHLASGRNEPWPRELERRIPFSRRKRLDIENMTAAATRFAAEDVQLALSVIGAAVDIHNESGELHAKRQLWELIQPHVNGLNKAGQLEFWQRRAWSSDAQGSEERDAALRRALALARELDNKEAVVTLEFELATGRILSTTPSREGFVALQARVQAERAGWSPECLISVLNSMGSLARRLGEAQASVRYSREMLELSLSHRGPAAAAGLMSNHALVVLDTGEYDEAERIVLEAIGIREQLNETGSAFSVGLLATLRLGQGRPVEALEIYARAIALYRRCGLVAFEHIDGGNRGLAYQMLGDLGRAQAALEQAVNWFDASSGIWPAAHFRAPLIAVLADQGKLDAAVALHEVQLAVLATVGDPRLYDLTELCLGHIDLARGDVDAALARLDSLDSPSVDFAIARHNLQAALDRRAAESPS